MLKLMGANRGSQFVDAVVDTQMHYKPMAGNFSVGCNHPFRFKGAKIDGVPAPVSHRLTGTVEEADGVFTTIPKEPDHTVFAGPSLNPIAPEATNMAFGEELKESSEFEISIYFKDELDIQAFVNNGGRPEWNSRNARGFDWKVTPSGTWGQTSRSVRADLLSEKKVINLQEGWHDFKVVTYIGGFDGYIDGELVVKTQLPHYPSVEAVADIDDGRVIVKIVNFTEETENIAIDLDIDVKSDYTVKLLTGDALAQNSIADSEHVHDIEFTAQGAARNFTYVAPPSSLSVLILHK